MGKNNLDFYEKSFIDVLDEYVFMLDSNGEIYNVNNTVLKELNCDLEYISKMNFFEISSFREEDFLRSDKEKISTISIILGNTKLCLNNINIIKKTLENKECYIILGKREKKMFMMDMSHELKTPINIILSTIQLLKKNIDDKAILCNKEINLISYLDSIKRNSFRILNLVNTIMDINKIEEGYYKINNGKCEIVSAIEDIIQSVVKYGEAKNLEIIFDTNIEEKFILCDIEKIEHILLNLLSNSIKYTNEGGKVEVSLEVLEGELKVSVKDNGIGIDKESLNMIFDRFYQGNNHKKLLKKSKGSGVGLFLVKSLVKIQNGTIYCKSEQEKGSEFVFTLPITECEDEVESLKDNFNFCINEYFEA
ncbi:MAG: HAMP domain-containing sensor histidine kinase [Clostridium perfringens]|nr:HAMP domain-containing sensor histidine kinase [Clostridium perfringens]